jgi:hypothetical protein
MGRRGAPASAAAPAPAPSTEAPELDSDDIFLEDFARPRFRSEDLLLEDVPTMAPAPVEERPLRLRHWVVLSALGLLALGGTGIIIVATARQPAPALAQATVGLIPADQMPKSANIDLQKADALEASYPEDPRIHALMAGSLIRGGAAGPAELELKEALKSPLLHAPEVPAGLEQHIRVMLVGEQLTLKEVDDARETAQPLCPEFASLDPRMRDALKLIHACGGR